jgi:hypothetical protein
LDWGAQAAGLQHSAASPNAPLSSQRTVRIQGLFAASCRELQDSGLCSPEHETFSL